MKHPDQSKPVTEINGLVFGRVCDIEKADWKHYETCRGPANKGHITDKLNVICDSTDDVIAKNDVLRDDIDEILWDLLCHQGTLYAATPLGLYVILSNLKKSQIKPNSEVAAFISHCKKHGSSAIYLSSDAIYRNLSGGMPMYRIEDVFNELHVA